MRRWMQREGEEPENDVGRGKASLDHARRGLEYVMGVADGVESPRPISR